MNKTFFHLVKLIQARLTLLDINEIHSSSLANIGTNDSLVTEKAEELSF